MYACLDSNYLAKMPLESNTSSTTDTRLPYNRAVPFATVSDLYFSILLGSWVAPSLSHTARWL